MRTSKFTAAINKYSADVIVITETRITKDTSVTENIELSNYSFEHTPAESSAGSY